MQEAHQTTINEHDACEPIPTVTDLLFASPDNPVPERASAAMIRMRDGKHVRVAIFQPENRKVEGTVLVLTGRNECIEKYFETVSDLTARGFTAVATDWRGQGFSDRIHRDRGRGHIGSFKHYVDDLDEIFTQILLPDCRGPYYVLAHSTGGLIALLAAPRMVNRVRRMVLSAPLLTLTGFPVAMPMIAGLARTLYWIGLGGRYLGSGPRPRETAPFEGNKVTSDRKRWARNQAIYDANPQLALGGPTAAWVRAACNASSVVHDERFMTRLLIPTLIVAAGADSIVSTPATEDYVSRLRSASLLTVDGAKHELLQERNIFRDQFLAAFDAFAPGS